MSELGNKFLGPFPIGLSFLLFIFSANFRGCWCEWKDDSYTKDPRLLLKAYRRSRTYKGWWVLFFFWILKGQQDWSGYSSISGQTWDCRECDVLLNKRKRDLLISLPLSWFEALIHCRLSLTWNFYYNVYSYAFISLFEENILFLISKIMNMSFWCYISCSRIGILITQMMVSLQKKKKRYDVLFFFSSGKT